MKTTVIFSYKGGEGRTTTTANLAYNLSERGYRVLMIDADQQCNLSYLYRRKNSRYSLYDVLSGTSRLQTAIRRTNYKNLDILPADSMLEMVKCEPDVLGKKLQEVDYVYDYCIIDCHPGYQVSTVNALSAADDMIIPLQANNYSVESLKDVISQVAKVKELNPDVHMPLISGCLVTMYQIGRTAKEIVGTILELCNKHNIRLYEVIIRRGNAVNDSIKVKKPLARSRTTANVTIDYQAFTDLYEAGE